MKMSNSIFNKRCIEKKYLFLYAHKILYILMMFNTENKTLESRDFTKFMSFRDKSINEGFLYKTLYTVQKILSQD